MQRAPTLVRLACSALPFPMQRTPFPHAAHSLSPCTVLPLPMQCTPLPYSSQSCDAVRGCSVRGCSVRGCGVRGCIVMPFVVSLRLLHAEPLMRFAMLDCVPLRTRGVCVRVLCGVRSLPWYDPQRVTFVWTSAPYVRMNRSSAL